MKSNRFYNHIPYAISITLTIIFVFLAYANFVSTTFINTTSNEYHELAIIKNDNLLVNLILLGVTIGIFMLFKKFTKLSNFNTQKLEILSLSFIFLIGIGWILLAKPVPVHDQAIVSSNAAAFLQGDYTALEFMEYLSIYPHQLGIVFIFEILYKIVGLNNFTFIMVSPGIFFIPKVKGSCPKIL